MKKTYFALLAAPLLALAAAPAPDAEAAAVKPTPLADAPPALLRYKAAAPAPKFRVTAELKTATAPPKTYSLTTDCSIGPDARLYCAKLGTLDLTPYAAPPGEKAMVADFADMTVAQTGAILTNIRVLEDDGPLDVNAVRAEWSWLWGWQCIIESSDQAECGSRCGAMGFDPSGICVVPNLSGSQCQAICQCRCGIAGEVIDTAPIPG
jgi:hypothetical protein